MSSLQPMVRWVNRVFTYQGAKAPAFIPTSCRSLAKLLKHLGLHFSDLPDMHNNLCSPRALGDPHGVLAVKGSELHCTTSVGAIILITAPTTGSFSAPIPTVHGQGFMFRGRRETPPACPGVSEATVVSCYSLLCNSPAPGLINLKFRGHQSVTR